MSVVRREYRKRVPRDLTTDEEALPVADILGVAAMHRVFFLGFDGPVRDDKAVFAYMVFPEGGPVEWLVQAAKRPQDSYTFTGPYEAAWARAVHWAVAMARKELHAELAATSPQEKKE